MSKRRHPIDKYLDEYTATTVPLPEGATYRWWWNGCDILADAIAAVCWHLRKDGTALYDTGELKQLKKLETYMRAFPTDKLSNVSPDARVWLHAEAMWLFGEWFSRLWD